MYRANLLQYACDPTGTTRSVVEVREGPGFSRGDPGESQFITAHNRE